MPPGINVASYIPVSDLATLAKYYESIGALPDHKYSAVVRSAVSIYAALIRGGNPECAFHEREAAIGYLRSLGFSTVQVSENHTNELVADLKVLSEKPPTSSEAERILLEAAMEEEE